MAEKDASSAIECVVQQLKEANTIERVPNIKSLILKVKSLNLFLKEFDGQESEPKVVHEIRDIAYDVQDNIESILNESKFQNSKGKLRKLLTGKSSIKNHLEAIEDIEKHIQNLAPFEDDAVPAPNPDISGSAIVKFTENQEDLVRQQLIYGGQQLQIILIFGKAGLGKTTLAKMVYNNVHITDTFSCKFWLGLPREVRIGEILWRILKKITQNTQTECRKTDVELMKELQNSLKDRKYLIVLENLCSNEVCSAILSSFPNDLKGSRILVTSRLEPDDFRINNNLSSHQVTPLDTSQSWELLSEKVFQGENCPSNLDELGKRMAGTCKGSPRAITSLAEVLTNAEKTSQIWAKYLQDLNQGKIWDYANLPKELLTYLLYMGLFPIDFDILAKQIIQMWVAEGLLKRNGNREAEEIGEDYLKELSKRSFIQAGIRKTRDNETMKTYRISSFTSHLCRTKGADEISLEVKDDKSGALGEKTIRLGIPNTSRQVLHSCNKVSPLRSLYCFGQGADSSPIHSAPFWKTLHCKFPLLRVLNMGSVKLDTVPKVIGKLIHLRYLRLVAPTVTHIPSSFGNLHNLETLDMRESHLHGQLHGIWKMKHLRHIYLAGFSMPNPPRFDCYKVLQNLQTLSGVHPDRILKQLMVKAKFPDIKRLRVCSLDQQMAFTFLSSLDHLYYLRSLRVEKPTNIPDSIAFPLSLSKITLLETQLKPDCIKILEKLPNLKVLKLLKKSIIGKKIVCSAGGFPQLEIFCLADLLLEEWILAEGAIPCLKCLDINECPKLEPNIPIDLQMLPGLATFASYKQ